MTVVEIDPAAENTADCFSKLSVTFQTSTYLKYKLSACHGVQKFLIGKNIKVNLLAAAGICVLTIEPYQS